MPGAPTVSDEELAGARAGNLLGLDPPEHRLDVADESAQIYTGTFAVARGGTKEVYELGDGRTYTITYAAEDASHNVTTHQAIVSVPHNQ